MIISALGRQYAGATWSAAHLARVAAGALDTSDTVPEIIVIESRIRRAAFWVPCRLRTWGRDNDIVTELYALHDAPTQARVAFARVPRCPGTDARVGQMPGYQVARVTFVRVSGCQVMWGCQGASAPWVWALRAQTQGASGQRRARLNLT